VAWAACLNQRLVLGRGARSQCESRGAPGETEHEEGSSRRWGAALSALALGSLLFACAPSREALTAGEVGCPPSEVSVSNEESSSGWGQSADTWIAECRGRRFVCSEVVTSGVDYGWLFSDDVDSRDSDVSCHEELSAAPAQPKAAEAALAPRSEPPSGGAGFELGLARAEARARCEASGHSFRDEGAQAFCSGPALPLGFEASPQLTFCNEVLCGITIAQVPPSSWATAFRDLDARLTDKYGPATVRRVRIPSVCRTPEQFDRCALDGALDFEVRWQWPEGVRLKLLLDKPAAPGVAAVRLMYSVPPGGRRETSAL
jgi:hypothetical protein